MSKNHYFRTAFLTASLVLGMASYTQANSSNNHEQPFQQGVKYAEKGDYQTAFKLWEPLAKTGDRYAQFNLGIMYTHGQGVTKDDKKAVYWFQKAAEQGDIYAQYNLGNRYYEGRGVEKDISTALSLWKQACNEGKGKKEACENYNAISNSKQKGHSQKSLSKQQDQQFELGFKHLKQDDYQTAFKILEPLAQAGNPDAQFYLGAMYLNGDGVSQNAKKAIHWYQKAAEQGDADAQFNLGVIYREGRTGVKKDFKKAVYWFQKAAEQGNPKAQHNLGLSYNSRGVGVTYDIPKAIFWLKKAAEQGLAQSQYELGLHHPRDKERLYWLQKTAEQGIANAQFYLGNHLESKGDFEQAIYWYEKANAQNHLGAPLLLAEVYYRHKKDINKALSLLKSICDGGDLIACGKYRLYSEEKSEGTQKQRK